MEDYKKSTGDLLVEFFSEEVPARMQFQSGVHLEESFKKAFDKRDICYGEIEILTGPRHLAIIIKQLDLKQQDQIIEKRGPRFDANEKALNGFLNSNDIDLIDTEIKDTKNGKFHFYIKKIKGLDTKKIIPEIIHEITYGFVWSKSQRWGSTDLRWARPLRNILLLLNDEVVEGELELGNSEVIKFSNHTYGHRHYDKKIEIDHISHYKKILIKNYVILNRDDRKYKISYDLEALLTKNKLSLLDDPLLLEEVTGLVEFPNVMLGSISNEFMSLPPEVLSTAMKVHQKYFSTIDHQNNLAPNFIFVANSLSDTKRDATVVEGNERVLKARLSDANFFWESDLSKTFEYWNDKLRKVVFYEGLGSVYDKTLRMSKISNFVSKAFNVNPSLASQTALLSKADLASEMVGEFPELQGVMGGYYSDLIGYQNEISKAITEHYKPRGALDSIPKTNIGGMLSIIDKIDTLTCFFVIGKKPTGSKDPFALRRSALGIVQIMIGFKINMTMHELFSNSLNLHNNVSKALETELMDFVLDRLRIILKAEGIKLDVIESILTLGIIHKLPFQIIYKRIATLSDIRNTENFKVFLVNFKRLNNILKSSNILKFSNFDINTDLFKSPIETQLFQAINDLKLVSEKYQFNLNNQEYFLNTIKELQTPINLFFETIIVNVENEAIKDNRLKLMFSLRELIIKYSNFDIIED